MKKGADLWVGCKLGAMVSWYLVFECLSSLSDAEDSLFFYLASLCFAVANISFLVGVAVFSFEGFWFQHMAFDFHGF